MRGGSEKRRGERGQTLVLFVLALAVLLGFTALAVDVGLFFTERRGAQNGADAAALAGASALPNNPSLARQLAGEWASNNGFSSGQVTVNTPYNGDPGKIEVIISDDSPAMFASVLGFTSFDVSARAVASIESGTTANAAILVLNETACKSFDASGTADLTINNDGGIVANSSCDPSLHRGGSGNISADGGIYYYAEGGGYNETGSGAFVPTPEALADRIEDPLAGLVPPNFTTLGQSPDSGGTPLVPNLKKLSSGSPPTLRPGVYYGGLEIGSGAIVTLQAGTYVMAGGGFKIGGGAKANGIGITVYNSRDPQKRTGAGACAGITLVGDADYNLVAPTSGPYKYVLFWQDRVCTNEMSFNGNGDNVGGVIYLPTARLDLSGSAGLGSVQIIADTVRVSGTGSMSVDFYPYFVIPIPKGLKLVE